MNNVIDFEAKRARKARMMKVSGCLIFQTWDEAIAAANALKRAGFAFAIMTGRVDICSRETTFAECYKTIAYDEQDACWEQIQAIIEPYRGDCDEFGEA